MKRWMVGGAVLIAMTVGIFSGGVREAGASKPFTPITKLKCVKCHKTEKGSEKDLNDCGKESQAYLKEKKYAYAGKPEKAKAEAAKYEGKIKKADFENTEFIKIDGFKCPAAK